MLTGPATLGTRTAAGTFSGATSELAIGNSSALTAASSQAPASERRPTADPLAAGVAPATAQQNAAQQNGAQHNAALLSAALQDPGGSPLPQTDNKPTNDSPLFVQRMQLLVRAIAENEPSLAHPSFFPVEAYKQVKAIERPERDWQRRLLAAFDRNIHEYHKQLGADAPNIRWVRLEVPEAKVKWMKPGSEGNRVGYFRVLRSKLVVATASGRERPLEVTSLISWRGEWYIVHLHGFE